MFATSFDITGSSLPCNKHSLFATINTQFECKVTYCAVSNKLWWFTAFLLTVYVICVLLDVRVYTLTTFSSSLLHQSKPIFQPFFVTVIAFRPTKLSHRNTPVTSVVRHFQALLSKNRETHWFWFVDDGMNSRLIEHTHKFSFWACSLPKQFNEHASSNTYK